MIQVGSRRLGYFSSRDLSDLRNHQLRLVLDGAKIAAARALIRPKFGEDMGPGDDAFERHRLGADRALRLGLGLFGLPLPWHGLGLPTLRLWKRRFAVLVPAKTTGIASAGEALRFRPLRTPAACLCKMLRHRRIQ